MSKELLQAKLDLVYPQLHNAKLMIVSKTRSMDEICAYYEIGHRDFGENRVSELMEKADKLSRPCPEIRWHMIGNLQSNKINTLFNIPTLFAIHSVDDQDILTKLIASSDRLKQNVKIFLQFNTSKEEAKAGFEDYESLKNAALSIPEDSKLKLAGLMTMGTLRTEDFEVEARRCFQELNELKSKLSAELKLNLETSMGMSQDYQIALEENSDWIRLGTMMFK